MDQFIEINNVRYEVCPCCGKPIRGTGKTCGGVAAIVVKPYVKNGKIVDLVAQTKRLLTAVGFEHTETVLASLVKETVAPDLFGGESVQSRVARKGFFRQLHERKRPDLKIDYEAVIFVRKP